MRKKGLIKVHCIDCGFLITIRADKNKDKELPEFGWEKKGDGWQCPDCYYEQKHSEEVSSEMGKKKKWDVTFVRYVGMIIEADTEEEARAIAEKMKDPNERVGVINEAEDEDGK